MRHKISFNLETQCSFQETDVNVSINGLILLSVMSLLILAMLGVLTTSRSTPTRLCKKRQIRVVDVLASSP